MTKFREKFHVKNFNQIQLIVETQACEIGQRCNHQLSHELDKRVLRFEKRSAGPSCVIKEKVVIRHYHWSIGTAVLKKTKRCECKYNKR
jgi:hypothetical protein